ncbi:MAG: universal stress protein [Planctomycetes bacterium]|nr:universal stress protein [Planctomycetota bacterium]HRV81813.1 universal stress protein [Planctomycetota bacterium]
MRPIHNILVGIDLRPRDGRLTQGSKSAIRQAARLARASGARVHFLYSDQHNPENEVGEDFDPAQGEAHLREFCARKGLPEASWLLSHEPAWLAIIHQVLSEGYDLVIVAKRNRSRRMDRKLGSTSMKLVRKCPCPVWVVQPDYEHDEGPILVATDLGPVGVEALAWGAELAQEEDRKLSVVHAMQVPLELQLGGSRLGDVEYQKLLDEELDKVTHEVHSHPIVRAMGKRAKVVISWGSPSEVILKVERKIEPSLTVLGSVGRGGIPGFLLGNTAERLVYRLESSLLVVKPKDFVCPVE